MKEALCKKYLNQLNVVVTVAGLQHLSVSVLKRDEQENWTQNKTG